MRLRKYSVISGMVLTLAFSISAWGTVINNGDFEMGDLSGWTKEGPGTVDASSKVAVMGTGYDPGTGAYITKLYQDFVIPEYPLPLTFDFLFETTGPDYSYSLGIIDALTVSLWTDMGDLLDFLIVDDSQLSCNTSLCSVTAGPGELYTLSTDVSSYSGANARILFRLWDEDDLADSTAKIDNVSCEPIPEPSTILLMLMGLCGIRILGRIKLNSA